MYQVVRVEKRKASAIGAMQSHNLRQYKTVAPNIDGEKSKSNVVLIECDDFASAINTRVGEIQSQQKRKIRKDCPRALEYVISASPEFFESATEEEKSDYFRKSLEYLKSRHGNENVISAVIHNDESTPHMHVVIVPVKDKKLNPKHYCDKFELQRLHSEFNERVGSVFGLERGEKSDRQHKTTVEYRREIARKVREEMISQGGFTAQDYRALNKLITDYKTAFKLGETISVSEVIKDIYQRLSITAPKLSQCDEITPERVEVQQTPQSQPMMSVEPNTTEEKKYRIMFGADECSMTAQDIHDWLRDYPEDLNTIADQLSEEDRAEVFGEPTQTTSPLRSKGYHR